MVALSVLNAIEKQILGEDLKNMYQKMTLKQLKTRKKERKEKSKAFQKSEWKKWHAKCWEAQKQYLRKKWVTFQDTVECFTCFKMIPVKEIHCGHFWHGKLDFDLRNLRPQCAGCNTFRDGNLAQYATRLVKEQGAEWYIKLDADAHQHKGYTLEDLKEKYISLLKDL